MRPEGIPSSSASPSSQEEEHVILFIALFLRILISFYEYVYMCGRACAHEYICLWSPEALDPLELELQEAVSCLT